MFRFAQKRRVTALSLTFILSLALGMTFGIAQTRANDLGFRWYRSGFSLWDYTTTYNTFIANSITDYNNNTDLGLSNPVYGPVEVIIDEANFGNTGWVGSAWPNNSGSRPCFNSSGMLTGLCNTTTYKARYGNIYFNSYYYFPNSYRDFAVRHEIGHFFGLAHVTCSTNSVMQYSYGCSNRPSNLQSDEINALNSWY